MAIITEVRFVHEHGALVDTLTALPEADVAITRGAPPDPDHSIYAVRFEGADLDEIEATLADDHTVYDVHPMPEFEDRQLLGVEFASGAMLLNPAVTQEGGFVVEARGATTDGRLRGWYERWLLPDEASLRNVWQYAREHDFEFEVLELHQHGRTDSEFRGTDAVTAPQREALTTAWRGGYFAEPREMSLDELAAALDLSPTAAAGRLRRGMKALIGSVLTVDDREE